MGDVAHLWFVHTHQKNFYNGHHFWELDLEEMRELVSNTFESKHTGLHIWHMKIVHIF